MAINWQLIIVGVIVTGAATYLVWRAARTWRAGKPGCGGSCGCAGSSEYQSAAFVSSDEITVRKLK